MKKKVTTPHSNKEENLGFFPTFIFFILTIFLSLNLCEFIIGKSKSYNGFDYVVSHFYGKETSAFFVVDNSFIPPHKIIVKNEKYSYFKNELGETVKENLITRQQKVLNEISKSWDEYIPKRKSVSNFKQSGIEKSLQAKDSKNEINSVIPSNINNEKKSNNVENSHVPRIGDIRKAVCTICWNGKLECDRCLGSGKIKGVNDYGDYGDVYCPNCNGKGYKQCYICDGKKEVYQQYYEHMGWAKCLKCYYNR
jgi:hypothetical protein